MTWWLWLAIAGYVCGCFAAARHVTVSVLSGVQRTKAALRRGDYVPWAEKEDARDSHDFVVWVWVFALAWPPFWVTWKLATTKPVRWLSGASLAERRFTDQERIEQQARRIRELERELWP